MALTLYEGDNELNVSMAPILANLSGTVTDADTLLPIEGVKVTIQGMTAYTDVNGIYAFTGLQLGSWPITFEKAGYETLVG